MRKISALLFLLLCSSIGFANPIHTEVYHVNTDSSTLEWTAQKVSGKHNGTIRLKSGELSNTHGSYTGTFVVDMNTIVDTDIQREESKAKLENHLKSADFFDAAAFPVSTFVLTSITPLAEPKDGHTHQVKGNLTIKDKTNEITFNSSMKADGNFIFATGTAVVDRSKFDIKYGSKTFFADIGDKMIYDEFTLLFKIVAERK